MQPKWYELATGELGTQEVVGKGNNPRILDYHKATGLAASEDEISWCGSFVAWCMSGAGVPYNKGDAAAARSWLKWGRELKEPTLGCVVIFWRQSPTSWQGHVGFYAGKTPDGKKILVLGGNQSNRVSIAPYDADRVLGFRWPAGVELPPDIQPMRESAVVRRSVGSAVTVAASTIAPMVIDGATAVVEQKPGIVQAQKDLTAGDIAGIILGVAGALMIIGIVVARMKAARKLREGKV